jgi:hypothetical protein
MEKSQYKTLSEWRKNCPNVYQKAQKKGLILEICKTFGWKYNLQNNKLPKGYWTKKRCIEEALKYKTKKDWADNSSSSYQMAYKNGWIKECTQHMLSRFIYTKELCYEYSIKYDSRSKWMKNDRSSYNAAIKNGWFDECTNHMKKPYKRKK